MIAHQLKQEWVRGAASWLQLNRIGVKVASTKTDSHISTTRRMKDGSSLFLEVIEGEDSTVIFRVEAYDF